MIISVEDKSYRCKNCDSFSQCKYYHHRRPDSHICKEFRNDWRQRDILDKISAEIELIANARSGSYADGLYRALDIVNEYKGVSE